MKSTEENISKKHLMENVVICNLFYVVYYTIVVTYIFANRGAKFSVPYFEIVYPLFLMLGFISLLSMVIQLWRPAVKIEKEKLKSPATEAVEFIQTTTENNTYAATNNDEEIQN